MSRKHNAALFMLLIIWPTTAPAKYAFRMLKNECNSSEKTANDLFCNVKNSKQTSLQSFGFNLNRKVKGGLVVNLNDLENV